MQISTRGCCCECWQQQRGKTKSGFHFEASWVTQSAFICKIYSKVCCPSPAPAFPYWLFTPDSPSIFRQYFNPHVSKVSYPLSVSPANNASTWDLSFLIHNFQAFQYSCFQPSFPTAIYVPFNISSYPLPCKLSIFLHCSTPGQSISNREPVCPSISSSPQPLSAATAKS